jgi:hypothetical protein
MRQVFVAIGVLLVALCLGASAHAQASAPSSPSMSSSGSPATAPAQATAPAPRAATASTGLAVVATDGATDAAWPLARAIYADPSLRPSRIDEGQARVLCGEAPAPGAPQELRDLADTVKAVKGDDAPSRALLSEVARRLSVRALVVVQAGADHPNARVFLADAGVFDAATYAPDSAPTLGWTAAAQSLARAYGVHSEPSSPPSAATAPTSAPPLATREESRLSVPPAPPTRKAFYETGWFWGALGAAAFAGGAIFLATRDNGEQTIHLQMQVPH